MKSRARKRELFEIKTRRSRHYAPMNACRVHADWQENCSLEDGGLVLQPVCCLKGAQMLRHVTSTLTACTLAGLVNVSAQEPPRAPQQTPSQSQESAPKETLTGCVMEAKTTDGGTAYVLNNAEGGSATMYVLAGPSQSEMAGNVNKKVEVTGPVQQPSAPSDGASANPKVLRPPAVQVESIKVVAETCK
jgi:hypothetical protein